MTSVSAEQSMEIRTNLVAFLFFQVVTLRATCLEEIGALLAIAYRRSVRPFQRSCPSALDLFEWQWLAVDWHGIKFLPFARKVFASAQCQ